MSGENEPIRANRLSNREVLFTPAAHNINMPSTSTAYETTKQMIAKLEQTDSIEKIEDESDEPSTNKFNSNIDEMTTTTTTTNTDDDLSLSQYELDIVNKYLNELGESDEDHDHNDINLNETFNNELPNTLSNVQENTEQNVSVDELVNDSDEMNTYIKSQDVSTVTPKPFTSSHADDNTIDTGRFTSTSRQIGFHQQYRNNDVNNNNIRLCSGSTQNNSIGHMNENSQRCDNNNRRTNTNNLNANHNSFAANLPIMVGITSCVWGLFYFAVKSLYSDMT